MSRIARKTLLVQLAAIEAVHEELQGGLQGFGTARQTARAACEPSQVMAQLGVIPFDRVGIGFAVRDCVDAKVIPQAIIRIEGVTVVALRLRSLVHQFLDHCLGALPDHLEAQVAAGQAIYDRDDEDLVFLSPMKVNSSSISASLTSLGTGGSGRALA